jgi:hypothetical protein
VALAGKPAELSCALECFHDFISHRAGGVMIKSPGGWRANDEDRSGPSPACFMAKKLDVPQSGKVGTTVNMATRYGQIQRQYVKPKDPKTEAQMTIRSNLARVSARWRVLTEEQRGAWMLAAEDVHSRPRLGKSARLTGCQLFIKINCARTAIRLDQFDVPPKVPEFGSNPVGELTISNTRGAIALKLSVLSTPAEHTIVYGAAPCSAGKYFVRHFNILGFLPEPVGGVSGITDIYVARYGVPKAGTRVCIRTQQHINGWDDLPKQTSAIVPKG